MIRIKNLVSINKKSIAAYVEFLIWFLLGILIITCFYQPFEQPILFDRAYLIYMSQVIYRGEPLYSVTTYGYTPLSALIVGYIMKFGGLFSIDTITSARLTGIVVYGAICAFFHLLCKNIFTNKTASITATTLLLGIGYLCIFASVNAEPKLFVLLFSILGILFITKGKWFWAGLFLGAAAMCWHVSVVSIIAGLIFLLRFERTKGNLSLFIVGALISILPILAYLMATDGWMDFFYQAVIRKIYVEGSTVGESPLKWIFKGIYPSVITESLHFVFGLIGFVVFIYLYFFHKSRLELFFSNRRILSFSMIYILCWAVFNSYEFQGPPDILPLLPVIIIFCTFAFLWATPKNRVIRVTTVLVLIIYNFHDTLSYRIPYSYSQQKAVVQQLQKKYYKVFVMDFEEYYVIHEKPMPTRFMRFAPHEDHIILSNPNTCDNIMNKIVEEGYDVIIKRDLNKSVKSAALQSLLRPIKRITGYRKTTLETGICAQKLLDALTNPKQTDHFTMRKQYIPYKDIYYIDEYYTIYTVRKIYNECPPNQKNINTL